MATYYSDHYSSDGVARTEVAAGGHKAPAAVNGGWLRYRAGRIDTTAIAETSLDSLRFFNVKSNEHFVAFYSSVGAAADTGSGADGGHAMGINETGQAQDGSAIDANLFGLPAAYASPRARTESLCGGTASDLSRGNTIWQILNEDSDDVPGDYPLDPQAVWTITALATGTRPAGRVILFELYFTANH